MNTKIDINDVSLVQAIKIINQHTEPCTQEMEEFIKAFCKELSKLSFIELKTLISIVQN